MTSTTAVSEHTEVFVPDDSYDVSIIIPIRNGEDYLDACMESIIGQDFTGQLQVSIYDDCSSDNTVAILESWRTKLHARNISLVTSYGLTSNPRGPGYGRNRAVEQCSGKFLCFADADDIMKPTRITKQHDAAKLHQNAIVGSRFVRYPPDSTRRFTKWANRLSPEQLYLQAYTSNGPTVIMPTWFCSRRVYDAVGGFDEGGLGVPEDLIFFNRHLDLGGSLVCVEDVLVTYCYYKSISATFSVTQEVIWKLRVAALERRILANWKAFTIWNAGKQGRRLFRSMAVENRKKVVAFCDVDAKKLAKGSYTYEDSESFPKIRIPIIHFRDAIAPFIICVKLDLTDNNFENNLASLNLTEGIDYFHFN